MRDEVMDTHCTNDAELSTSLKSRAPEQPSPGFPQLNVLGSEMHLPALVTQCLREIDHDRRGKPCMDSSRVELFRVRSWKTIPKPGFGCNSALAGWCATDCIAIPTKRQYIVWGAKRAM